MAGALLTLAGCLQPRYIAPRITIAPPRPQPISGGVRIGQLTIHCSSPISPSSACPSASTVELASRIGAQVEAAFPAKDSKSPPIEIKIRVDARWTSRQTYLLDGVSVLTLGASPLTPQWGNASLDTQIILSRPSILPSEPAPRDEGPRPPDPEAPASQPASRPRPASGPASTSASGPASAPAWDDEELVVEEKTLSRIELQVKVPYRVHWCSWYRTDAPAMAFTDGWKMLVDQIVDRIGAHVAPPVAPVQPVTRWSGRYLAGGEDDEVEAETRRGTDGDILTEQTKIVLERGNEWRLLTRARQRTTARGLLYKYLSAFSGLEAGYFLGRAWVSSEAKDASGATFTIASGQASSSGWRIGAYTIPNRSDWFIFPTLGFFSLDIDIHDFRQTIPVVNVPGATEIRGVGSDPATGRPVDLGDPNVYRLELRSMYFGQRISGTLVYGTYDYQVFGTLEGGINLLEARHTRIYLGNYTSAGWSAAWVRSGQVRAILGFAIRPWHVALRCEMNYEGYFTFSYPEALQFTGPLRYNDIKLHYERPQYNVTAASAGTLNVFFGANLYF
jgi:hypothetical protein